MGMDGVFGNHPCDAAPMPSHPPESARPSRVAVDESMRTVPSPSGTRSFRRSLNRAGFDPQDSFLARQAMDEACLFLREFCIVTPAKRRQIAITVLLHVGAGMRDPHRLALKAIVRSG